jgi:hypothetical protein
VSIASGDRVKVIGVPPGIRDKDDLRTKSLLEECVGHIFEVIEVENVEGLRPPLVRLDVGGVLGKRSWEDTIWIEPDFVELVSE